MKKLLLILFAFLVVGGIFVLADPTYKTVYNSFTRTRDYVVETFDWHNLTSFPVACPSGYSVTALDGSVTCTEFVNTTGGQRITGPLNFSNSLGSDLKLNGTGAYVGNNKASDPVIDVCRYDGTNPEVYSQCDYVCSDTNCGDDINAIQLLLSSNGGGTITLHDGIYPVYTNIIGYDNITIQGESWNTRLNGTHQLHYIIYLNGTSTNYVENYAIKNIRFDGRKAPKPIMANYVKNLVIDHNWITIANGTCIGPDYLERFSITNNLVENCNQGEINANGIGVGGSARDGVISNNIIKNAKSNGGSYGYGILLERLGGGSLHENIVITSNSIFNMTAGIVMMGAKDITIDGNTIMNSTSKGIMDSGVTPMLETVISNNVIKNCGDDAIYIGNKNSTNNIVTGNNIIKNKGYGIVMRSNLSSITNNIITNNTKDGIYITRSGTIIPSDIIISNNIIEKNEIGIYVNNVTRLVVTGNNVRRNRQYGGYVATSHYSILSDNVFWDNGQKTANTYDGFRLASSNFTIINGNNAAGSGTPKQKYGIIVTACYNTTVTSNIANGDTDGLLVTGGGGNINEHNFEWVV